MVWLGPGISADSSHWWNIDSFTTELTLMGANEWKGGKKVKKGKGEILR
jgi:hypothetical protein